MAGKQEMNDLDDNDDDGKIEIEDVDDTPEADRGKPRRPEGAAPDVPDDDEIAGYSESVQKRIRKLRYEFHEERRLKEEAERREQEAIEFAKRAHEDATLLRTAVSRTEGTAIDQAKQRVASEIAVAEAAFKAAYESGDADELLKAQSKLTELKNEEYRLKSFRPAQPPQVQTQQPRPQQAQPNIPKPSARADEWARKNAWFGRAGSEDMTAQAFVAHERAIKQGIAPDSDEYYAQIDRAVRSMFPDRFVDADAGQQQRQKVGVVVAPASRSSSQNPRKVVLTSTQVALAKRLGISTEAYAAQLLKEGKNNG